MIALAFHLQRGKDITHFLSFSHHYTVSCLINIRIIEAYDTFPYSKKGGEILNLNFNG